MIIIINIILSLVNGAENILENTQKSKVFDPELDKLNE